MFSHVRLHNVTVPHKVLLNPETIVEQNQHLIKSMSPSAPVSFRSHEQRSDATPFPYPTLLDILWHIILHSYHRLFVVKTRSQQQSIAHPIRIRVTSISTSCLTVVNTSLYLVPGVLAIRPRRPLPPEMSGEPHSAGPLRY